MNAIKKMPSGPALHRGDLRCRLGRRWGFTCPLCGTAEVVGGYHRSSRKTAKDALHHHMTKKHAGPR